MTVEFKLEGAKAVQEMLIKVGPDIAKAGGKRGVFEASKIMLRAVKRASPVSQNKRIVKTHPHGGPDTPPSGTLKRDWSVDRLPQNRRGDAVAYAVNIDRYYFELLEFAGLKPSKRDRRYRWRKMPQRRGRDNPFARTAMNSVKHKSADRIVSATRKALIKEANKINNISKRESKTTYFWNKFE